MNSLFLTMIFIFSALWANIATGSEGAKIKVSSSVFDFGEITQGDQVDHLFTYKNIGDEPLTIGRVKTSCGCTVALPSKTNLLPNEDGELKVTFDSGRFHGNIHKEIYLSSNDKQNPLAKLVLTAKINPSITLSPETINFHFVAQEKSKTMYLNIKNNGSSNLEISSVEVSTPSISVKPATAVIGKNDTLKFEIIALAPTGDKSELNLNGYILFHTNRAQQELLRIPFYRKGALL